MTAKQSVRRRSMYDLIAILGALAVGLIIAYMFYRFTKALKEV